jgi:hypothetical protein
MDDNEVKARVKKSLDELSGRTVMRNDGKYYRSPEFRDDELLDEASVQLHFDAAETLEQSLSDLRDHE